MGFVAPAWESAKWRQELVEELTENILPFWMAHVVDKVHGGFHGAVTNDLRVLDEVPRSAVLCARILWTYSTAYRRLRRKDYLSMARRAYKYLTEVFLGQGLRRPLLASRR
ncbi:MAG: hypothetical protein ACUVRM_01895 [Bacillota bacterium]